MTGLFFLIITFQKANSLTLLRAIGAPAGRLVRSLLVQVVVIVGGRPRASAPLLYYAAVAASARRHPAALRDQRGRVLVGRCCWSLGVLELAVRRARRVLRIDPIEATTGAGVGSMKLALRELRRRPGRFATATVILTLIAHAADVPRRPARRADRDSRPARCGPSDADVIVLLRHVAGLVRPQPHHARRARPGRGGRRRRPTSAGSAACSSAPACRANGPRDLVASVALFGYELAPDGRAGAARRRRRRTPTRRCEADGVEEGMVIEARPGSARPVEVVGFVDGHASYSGQGDACGRRPTRGATC